MTSFEASEAGRRGGTTASRAFSPFSIFLGLEWAAHLAGIPSLPNLQDNLGFPCTYALCTLGGFWWGMSGILAIVSVISRLGRGVCGSRTCCRPEIPLLRRSCVCRRWRVWERRQLERLAQQSTLDIAERFDQQVRLEFVQIRHAPQERGPASAVRRHLGLWGGLERSVQLRCPSPPCVTATRPRRRVVRN